MNRAALARRQPGLTYRRKVLFTQIGVILGAVALVEIVLRAAGSDQQLFPRPSLILSSMGEVFADAAVRSALGLLAVELVAAFVLSIVIGGAVGWAVGVTRKAEQVSLPILLLLYSTPQVTLLPLFALVFGPGPGSKIAFGVSHGMFPIALAVIASLDQARATPIYTRWAASLGASPLQRLLRVQLMQTLGAILVGMRLAMATALLGVLLADLYISSQGVGYYVRLFTETLQGPKLFALITLLAILAIGINWLVSRLERRSIHWKS